MASIALAAPRKPFAPCNRNVGTSGRRAALAGAQTRNTMIAATVRGVNRKPAALDAVEKPGWKIVSTRPGTFGIPTAVKAAGVQRARHQSPKNGVPKKSVRCNKAAAGLQAAAPATTAVVASGATPVPSPFSSFSAATVFAAPAWEYSWVNPRYSLDSVVFDGSAPYDELEFVPLNGNDIDDADWGAPALDAGSAASVAKFAPTGSMQLTTPFRAHRPISIFAAEEDDSRELNMEGQWAPVSRCESLPQEEPLRLEREADDKNVVISDCTTAGPDVIQPTQLERLQAMLALITNRK